MDSIYIRDTIQRLLNGDGNGTIDWDRCGQWADTIRVLQEAATYGTHAVRQTFDRMARTYRELAIIVASDQVDLAPAPTDIEIPPLRSDITVTTDPAHTWLDMYIAYSRRWSPRSWEDFHECVAIWLLSVVAARRVVTYLGKPRYTPLYIALVSRSGLHAKSTVAEIGIDVLRWAGLDWMVTSTTMTPARFIQDRVYRAPDNFLQLPTTVQEHHKRIIGFAGQRGWWFDEFGMLVGSMTRNNSVMAEFSGLLRRFDECDSVYQHATVGRGVEEIKFPYLSLLAALTPSDLRSSMHRSAPGWTNGLWPRWAFSCPPEHSFRHERFPLGKRRPPSDLVRQLNEWHQTLGIPDVHVDQRVDGLNVHVAFPKPTVVSLTPDVVERYYAYNNALIEIIANNDLDDLDSWYARLHDKALRVAILLASVSGADEVSEAHWMRAQAICERWRSSIHRLYQHMSEREPSTEASAEDAILSVIRRLRSPTARDIKTRLKWLGRSEIETICAKLVQAGVLTIITTSHSTRYRLADDVVESTWAEETND